MSCSIRRNKVLLDSTSATTGDWIRLDSRYEDSPERSIQISMNSNDTITIQGTTVDIRGQEDPTDNIKSEDIVDLSSFSAKTSTVLNGNWTYIRAVKTGTSGPAKVQGFV